METGESRTPRPEEPIIRMCYKLVRRFALGLSRHRRRNLERPSRFIFGRPYRRRVGRIPELWRLTSPHPGVAGSRRSGSRPLERIHVRQLLFCHLINEVDGASACNPLQNAPVEPARPHFVPWLRRHLRPLPPYR